MKKLICMIFSLLLVAALAAGCAGSGKGLLMDSANPQTNTYSYDGGYYDNAVMAEAAMDEPAAEPVAAPAGLGTADTQSLSTPDYGGRKVIRNISISLETDAFDDNVDALLKKVNEVGGYVEGSNVDGRKPQVYNDPGRYGYFTFRIPVDRVDEFVENAKGYGTLLSCNENAEDITSRYFDMETRLSVLRTQLDRLTNILVATDNLADVIELEKEIARVTLEIEELTTELRRYDGLVDYATVTVNLNELRLSQGPVAEQTVGERIGEQFADSLYGVGTFCVNAFVWFVGALPVLLFIAAIGLAIFFIIRGGKKRREKRTARRAARFADKAEKLRLKMEANNAAVEQRTQADPGRAEAINDMEDKNND